MGMSIGELYQLLDPRGNRIRVRYSHGSSVIDAIGNIIAETENFVKIELINRRTGYSSVKVVNKAQIMDAEVLKSKIAENA